MTLALKLRHRQNAFALDVAFESAGRLTALFGASGSGKTTLINLIAGLLRPDRGSIAIDGVVLVDTGRRLFVPPHRRRIGYVFQDARLFPHLTVRQNLLYGRYFAPRGAGAADFDDVVGLLGISALLERRPSLLSGGEKSRVAIGRALLSNPRLILMDEPLASLDAARKAEILPYIERLRDETKVPIVYVSHALAEVSRLATDVVLLDAGQVTASGPADAVLSRLDLLPEDERGESGARIALEIVGHDEAFALTEARSAAGVWFLPRIAAPVGAKVTASVRARDVMVALDRPQGISALNVLAGRVADIQPVGDADALVTLDCGGDRLLARLTRRSIAALDLVPGKPVHAIVKAVAFDRHSVAATGSVT